MQHDTRLVERAANKQLEKGAESWKTCRRTMKNEYTRPHHHHNNSTSLQHTNHHRRPGHVRNLKVDVHQTPHHRSRARPSSSLHAPSERQMQFAASHASSGWTSGSQAHIRTNRLKPQLHCPPSLDRPIHHFLVLIEAHCEYPTSSVMLTRDDVTECTPAAPGVKPGACSTAFTPFLSLSLSNVLQSRLR